MYISCSTITVHSNRRPRIIYRNSSFVEWIVSPNRAIQEPKKIKKIVGKEKNDAYQTPFVCIYAEHHIQKAPIFLVRAHIHIHIPYFYASCSYPHPFFHKPFQIPIPVDLYTHISSHFQMPYPGPNSTTFGSSLTVFSFLLPFPRYSTRLKRHINPAKLRKRKNKKEENRKQKRENTKILSDTCTSLTVERQKSVSRGS